MKRVLIITEKFPPNPETAANRPLGWAKYFNKFGYKPIIVTRNWDIAYSKNIAEYQYTPVGDDVIHKIYDTHEVYYLPFKGNFRTRFILKHQYLRYKLACKAITFVDQLATVMGWYKVSMYRPYYDWAGQFLEQNEDIDLVLITGSPFTFFHLGKRIKEKYGRRWIADYRDPWTVPEGVMGRMGGGRLHRFMEQLEHKAEYRWVRTAAKVTSVSDYITQKIASFVNVPGVTIYNGYFPEEKMLNMPATGISSDKKRFTILYNGSLYPIQQIEIFLEGFKLLVDYFKGSIDVHFAGIGIDSVPGAAERVLKQLKGYEAHASVTRRIPKAEYLQLQGAAQVLLMAGTGTEIKGITSSKIFDYMLIEKPVLVVANDKDVVEKILTETGQGLFADTPAEVLEQLKPLVEHYLKTGAIEIHYNQEAVAQYSREAQTQHMARIFDEILQ